MRCPKCGYISFDHLESCNKCGKDISSFSTKLNGPGYKIYSPSFLKIEYDDPEEEIAEKVEETAEEAFDFVVDNEENDSEYAEGESLEFGIADSEDSQEQSEETGDGIEFSPDAPIEEETTTELDEASEHEPTIDFDGLDLSDLAPPETVERTSDKQSDHQEEMFFDPSTDQTDDNALEDLQLDDIDIGNTSLSFSTDSQKNHDAKSAKTGTALDEFDFDLGEL